MNELADSPLLNIINAIHGQHIKPSSDNWRDALLAARANPADVDRIVVKMIIAMAALQDAAKHAETVLRRELAVSMEQDRVLSFETEHHLITRAQAPRRAQITDRKMFADAHPDMMLPQDAKPDLTEAARRIKLGQAVVGCEMSNGGPPVLRLTAKTGTPSP